MTSRVDFTARTISAPRGLARRLRGLGPVVEVNFPIVGRVSATATQALADRVLKDADTFTMRKARRSRGMRWWMPEIVKTFTDGMLSMRQPHRRGSPVSSMKPSAAALCSIRRRRRGDRRSAGPATVVRGRSGRPDQALRARPAVVGNLRVPRTTTGRSANFMAWAEGLARFAGRWILRPLPKSSQSSAISKRMSKLPPRRWRGIDPPKSYRASRRRAADRQREIVSIVFLLLFASHRRQRISLQAPCMNCSRTPILRDLA